MCLILSTRLDINQTVSEGKKEGRLGRNRVCSAPPAGSRSFDQPQSVSVSGFRSPLSPSTVAGVPPVCLSGIRKVIVRGELKWD